MNVTYIVLGVVLVIVLYLIYIYMFSGVKTIATMLDCTTIYTVIPGTSLPTPTSVSYAYGVWIYIQNWLPAANGYQNIFCRQSTSATASTIYYTLKVYMAKNTPTLYVDFRSTDDMPSTTTTSTTDNQMVITNNFPLQKWVCLVVSVDSVNCDVYMDGKMIKTTPMTTSATLSPSPQPNADYGVKCGPFGGYLAGLTNWNQTLDPQSVWNFYLKGNGVSALGSTYGMQVDILSNGQVDSTVTVF